MTPDTAARERGLRTATRDANLAGVRGVSNKIIARKQRHGATHHTVSYAASSAPSASARGKRTQFSRNMYS